MAMYCQLLQLLHIIVLNLDDLVYREKWEQIYIDVDIIIQWLITIERYKYVNIILLKTTKIASFF